MIYADDLEALVKTSGCESPRHCVFTMAPTDQSTGEVLGPTNVFFPANLSDAVGLQDPQLKVKSLFIVLFFLACTRVLIQVLSFINATAPFLCHQTRRN